MKKIILLLIFIILITTSCNQEEQDIIGAYTTVIDKLYNEDMALNHDIKYIAVDTSLINNLSDDQKAILLKEVENYGYKVLDMTFEELVQEGYIEDLYFEDGILFKIEDISKSKNSITMNVSKWRSGLGAIGYNGLVVKYKNGEWKVIKTENAWIS